LQQTWISAATTSNALSTAHKCKHAVNSHMHHKHGHSGCQQLPAWHAAA
jgi:hypothetical protein